MEIIDRIKDIIFKIKDYDRLESDYCTCLCYFTKDKMSKPNYKIEAVKEVIIDSIGEYIDEGYNCAKEEFFEEFTDWFKSNFRQSPYDATKIITHYTSMDEAINGLKKSIKMR